MKSSSAVIAIARALINDPEVDAVSIATPPNSHKEYTLMAAAAGKPVYVEKPMAMNHAQCQEMVDACAAAGVPRVRRALRLPRRMSEEPLHRDTVLTRAS